MGRRILLVPPRVPSAGRLCPQAASAESIKAAEGGSHPTLCIYETAPARYLPELQKHPRKSQVLQSHEAITSFGCKIAPCGRFGAQECYFFEKKNVSTSLLPRVHGHELQIPFREEKIEGNQ